MVDYIDLIELPPLGLSQLSMRLGANLGQPRYHVYTIHYYSRTLMQARLNSNPQLHYPNYRAKSESGTRAS
jgi:hypothetical protein